MGSPLFVRRYTMQKMVLATIRSRASDWPKSVDDVTTISDHSIRDSPEARADDMKPSAASDRASHYPNQDDDWLFSFNSSVFPILSALISVIVVTIDKGVAVNQA